MYRGYVYDRTGADSRGFTGCIGPMSTTEQGLILEFFIYIRYSQMKYKTNNSSDVINLDSFND